MNYFEKLVPIPKVPGKIIHQRSGEDTFVAYEYERTYDQEKKRSHSKYARIGKLTPFFPGLMFPNVNYIRYFRSPDPPEEEEDEAENSEDDEDEEDIDWRDMRGERSNLLRVGSYAAFRKVLSQMDLEERLEDLFGCTQAAFLVDLAVSEIIQGTNTRREYANYNEGHPLFTRDMVMYSEHETCDFIHDLDQKDMREFLDDWNRGRDRNQKLCVSYATVGKQDGWFDSWSPGSMEFVDGAKLEEAGREEEEEDDFFDDEAWDPDYVVAYDAQNRVPLFYEGIRRKKFIGIDQIETLTGRMKARGYHSFRFLMDQGLYDDRLPGFLVDHGQDFLISALGDRSFALPVVEQVRGTFETKIPKYPKVRYMPHTTVKHTLYPEDEHEYFFHIFYDSQEEKRLREEVQDGLDEAMDHPEYFQNPEARLAFLQGKYDSAGYFCIVTSDEMTADEALALCIGKDVLERIMLRGNPYIRPRDYPDCCPYPGYYADEMKPGCAFVEFLALIILSEFYTTLKDRCTYMYAPPGDLVEREVFELEDIFLYRESGTLDWQLLSDLDYRKRNALSKVGISITELKKDMAELNWNLLSYLL